MNRRYALLFLIFCACTATAKINRFHKPAPAARGFDIPGNGSGQIYIQDLPAIRNGISNIRQHDSIAIPLQDGGELVFALVETQTLQERDQIKPIRSFRGTNGPFELRLTLSELGMSGLIEAADGRQIYFGPERPQNAEWLKVYDAAPERDNRRADCGTEASAGPEPVSGSKSSLAGGDNLLRTYVLAVSTTGEYTTWAGSVSAAQALVATTINNVNLRYERDFNVHLTVTAPSSVIYPTAGSDPYTTTTFPSSTTLNEVNSALSSNLGSAAYNLGIVFGYGWSGGLAQLASVCTGSKGRAAAGLNSSFSTGSSGPVMDDLVAHEIGHQFNATHTMASNNGGCSGNTNPATGWEPGGGSTIMAYAGTCTGNSYQTNPDHYFHAGSIAQVMAFIQTGTGAGCAVTSNPGNASPVVSVPASSYSIPHSTPFRLSATAGDADVSDVLTYTWEQLNPIGGTGTATPPSPTATTGPNFRSLPPATYINRYFPRLEVLNGSASATYEVLPAVPRTMNFRLTVRDNHSGSGRTAYEDVAVVTQSCGPFSVTSPSGATALTANGSNTISLTWNPATACVTMPNINIRFSTDGGFSFPYLLLGNTLNDGAETITVPNYPTCKGKIMIESIGSIYHNVSAGDISLSSSCGANGASFSPSTPFSAAAGNAALNLSQTPDYGTALSLPISGTLTITDPAGNLSFFDQNTGACSGPSNANNYDTIAVYPSVAGSYTFTLTTSAGGRVMSIYEQHYSPGSPCNNFVSSNAVRPTGSGSLSLSASFSATLCAIKRYILLVSSFSNGTPALPSSYSINVTSPAGGALFSAMPPPSGFNYCYAIVRASTGTVLDVVSSPNMTNAMQYPSGVYEIHGISSGSGCSALATTFNGGSLTALRTAIQNQTSGLCAQLSSNLRTVTVGTGSALPLRLLSFNVTALESGSAGLNWRINHHAGLQPFEVERSLDGHSFSRIGSADALPMSAVDAAYRFEDASFSSLSAGTIYYRLRITEAGGAIVFSPIEQLRKTAIPDAVSIAPNPVANDVAILTINSSKDARCELSLSDVSGRELKGSRTLNLPAGTSEHRIELQGLPAGMYFLKTRWDGKTQLLKVTKL